MDEQEHRQLQQLSLMQQHRDVASMLPPEAAARLVQEAGYTLCMCLIIFSILKDSVIRLPFRLFLTDIYFQHVMYKVLQKFYLTGYGEKVRQE